MSSIELNSESHSESSTADIYNYNESLIYSSVSVCLSGLIKIEGKNKYLFQWEEFKGNNLSLINYFRGASDFVRNSLN